MKIVFVCLGNICRSPMAEAVFRQMVQDAGIGGHVQIDSAATSSWEQGNPVHRGTREKLKSVGISTDGMYSRQLSEVDLDADYLIGMDEDNIAAIRRFVHGRSKAVITTLLAMAGVNRDIADPWYTGDFEQTYQDVMRGCTALMEVVKKQLAEGDVSHG